MYTGNVKKVEGSACPICLEGMNEPTEIIITNCKHAFHEDCMTIHLHRDESQKCPYCRQMPIPLVRVKEPSSNAKANPYIECKMLRALRSGNLNYINAALLAEPELIHKLYENKENNEHSTLLMLAARFGHKEIVTYLLNKIDSDSINKFSSEDLSALSHACMFGHVEIAELLIRAGARVNQTNSDGRSALWFAACEGKRNVIELLVKFGASVTDKTEGDFTALFIAAQKGHREVVDYLISVIPKKELKEHVNICSSSTTTSATALFMAAQAGHTAIVFSLISAGANPNQPLAVGQIPLHIAASNGHLEVVNVLIANGTNVNHQGPSGVTPLAYAAAKGHKEICECLLEANADPALGYYYEESIFRRQVSVVEIARDNNHLELADHIANYRR